MFKSQHCAFKFSAKNSQITLCCQAAIVLRVAKKQAAMVFQRLPSQLEELQTCSLPLRLPCRTFSDTDLGSHDSACQSFQRLPRDTEEHDRQSQIHVPFLCLPSGCSEASGIEEHDRQSQIHQPFLRLPSGCSEGRSFRNKVIKSRKKQHSRGKANVCRQAKAVSASARLPWGRTVQVDRSLKQTLQPDILDGELRQDPLPQQTTLGTVRLIALFCMSLTGAMQFDVQQGQDLLQGSVANEAWGWLASAMAVFVAPPCRLYSSLMLSNWGRMSWESRLRVAEHGLRCLKIGIEACIEAARQGKLFCFEHPFKSKALSLNLVQSLLLYPGATIVRFDQCRYGLVSPGGTPVRKRTFFVTNCPSIVQEFQGKFCTGNHSHRVCQGCECGIRVSKHCEKYPLPLVTAVQKCLGV